jgi:hypothetical protein
MAVASPQDVETSLLRSLTEAESLHVEPLLERAERLLTSRIPDLVPKTLGSGSFGALVADIEAEMVARVLRAPDSGIMRQESEGSYSYSLNLQVASGLLDVLPAEWEKLGVGPWRSVGPVTDGYLATRRGGVQPPWQFQYGWPAQNDVSEGLGWP